ncbi:MAG: NAD-dependent epimerase/dehydratase family protein [Myxococcota bacterium]|nr:NAD-dependent epimerase/dehydratase family protein [Myxococcota bacterium]
MKVLVTGGGGFLGRAILKQLSTFYPNAERHTLQRSHHPDLESKGIVQHLGSLSDIKTVDTAVSNAEIVFHVAAKAGIWGNYQDYYTTNVLGTEQILSACEKYGVKQLIYTSTPSVVHAGGDLEGVDESAPYATRFSTHYPATKAIAEKMVLGANSDTLATMALRPHLIWGPGDNHLVPRLIAQAKQGRLRFIGSGENLIDGVYIENAASAHIAAVKHLKPKANCAGKAYFITQGEPLPLKDLVNGIVEAAGLPKIEKTMSPKLAYAIGCFLEAIYKLFGIQNDPPMTRFVAEQFSTAHWYSIQAARDDLGYEPTISTTQGLKKLAESLGTIPP